jgi:hypothetical protein
MNEQQAIEALKSFGYNLKYRDLSGGTLLFTCNGEKVKDEWEGVEYGRMRYSGKEFTKGKVYKRNTDVKIDEFEAFFDNSGNTNGYSRQNRNHFTPATKEEYDLQNVTVKPYCWGDSLSEGANVSFEFMCSIPFDVNKFEGSSEYLAKHLENFLREKLDNGIKK